MAKYESQSQEVLGNHIRLGIMTNMAPPELQTHLPLNVGQWATYFEARKIVVDYLMNKSTTSRGEPMDVN